VTTLRTRLIVAFVAATLVPVGATVWVASSLLDRSLGYGATEELDRLSRTLEDTTRQFYQLQRDALRRDAADGRVDATRFAMADAAAWPDPVRTFWESGEAERFAVTGPGGDRLELMRRTDQGVALFGRALGGVHMETLATELRRTRELVTASRSRDLRRGLTLTLVLLIATVWLASLAPLIFLAHRFSRPIRQLTAGLTDFAAGDWTRRVDDAGDDEVGRAIQAFNRMAAQLRRDRDRLVYLTQMASWQLLARKTSCARAEELADADSSDRRGDAGSTAGRRSSLPGASGADRRVGNRNP
jgi:HAMP domain-containing protein